MKYFFVLVAAFCLCVAPFPAYATGFVPQWEVGDSWVVQASYRDLLAEDSNEKWNEPVNWEFKVRAIRNIANVECYVIHIYPQDSEMNVQAILWLGVQDLRPIRVIDVFPSASGIQSSRRDFHPDYPEPLSSIDSIIPYDLPMFPLVRRQTQSADSPDGFDAYRRGGTAKQRHNQVARAGGISFRRIVSQSTSAPSKQFSDVFSQYRAGGQTYQVEISQERSSEKMTQLWQQNSPWALSIQTQNMRARLLQNTPSEDETQQQGGR